MKETNFEVFLLYFLEETQCRILQKVRGMSQTLENEQQRTVNIYVFFGSSFIRVIYIYIYI